MQRVHQNLRPSIYFIAVISLLGCFNSLKASAQEQKWSMTVKVVDDDGKAVPDANVSVRSFVRRAQYDDSPTNWNKFEGLSDATGTFTASNRDTTHQLEFSVKKAGYYSTSGQHWMFVTERMTSQQFSSTFNPKIALLLKRIVHRVPMYVNQLDIAHREKPAMDKPVGFDLTIGDFVVPYGKGTNAQMYFTWHVDYDTNDLSAVYGKVNSHGWDGRMTISFPNRGDGIQEFEVSGRLTDEFPNDTIRSELRSSQLAPIAGYQAQLVKTNRWNFGKLGSANNYDHVHKNYFLRVNTVLDKDGNVKSAQYGKIYGDFEEALTTYLNPEPNSREIEYDMEHNLGQGGKNFYFTY